MPVAANGSVSPNPPTAAADVPPQKPVERTGKFAAYVAFGIMLSSLLGMVRQSFFGFFFGTSAAADAYNAAARIPNILQNLFGEGALSASFIPVYTNLLARGEREEADRVAGAVGALLALVTALLVLVGILLAPLLTASVAVGFDAERRDLTTRLIRIMFPAIGLLVCGAWCLGVLNSHRKFLLSYTAPVWWNLVLIGTLAYAGPGTTVGMGQVHLAVLLAWATVVATAVQLLVQIGPVLRAAPGLRFRLDATSPHVRAITRNFAPVLVGRGVVQLSAYIDSAIASLVGLGAVSIFAYAQAIYLIPGRIFGNSISAAELPAMSSLDHADPELHARLCSRLQGGLRRIAFFIIPSVVAFLALGDVIAMGVFRYGKFTHADALWVWGTLAGSTVGLLASTMGRLYSSAFYALKDTRTPLRFAVVRVTLTLVLGFALAVVLPPRLGLSARWGTAGLTASAGLAGWVEFILLRRALGRRIGRSGVPTGVLARLWLAALVAGGAGWLAKPLFAGAPNVVVAVGVCGAFGLVYLAMTLLLGEGQARALVTTFRRRLTGGRGR